MTNLFESKQTRDYEHSKTTETKIALRECSAQPQENIGRQNSLRDDTEYTSTL